MNLPDPIELFKKSPAYRHALAQAEEEQLVRRRALVADRQAAEAECARVTPKLLAAAQKTDEHLAKIEDELREARARKAAAWADLATAGHARTAAAAKANRELAELAPAVIAERVDRWRAQWQEDRARFRFVTEDSRQKDAFGTPLATGFGVLKSNRPSPTAYITRLLAIIQEGEALQFEALSEADTLAKLDALEKSLPDANAIVELYRKDRPTGATP